MTLNIGSGGSYKEAVSGTSFRTGGVWKNIDSMYIGVGGAWKQFYANTEEYLLTRGVNGVAPNIQTGYGITLFFIGLIVPNLFKGSFISDLYTNTTDSGVTWSLIIRISGSHPQSFFTTLECSQGTFTSASAAYGPGANTTWVWSNIGGTGFPGTGSETVSIT